MSSDPQTIEIYEKIKAILMRQGVSFYDCFELIKALDMDICKEIAKQIADNVKSDKLLDVYDLASNPNPDNTKILLECGTSMENVVATHREMLQAVVNKLEQAVNKPQQAQVNNQPG